MLSDGRKRHFAPGPSGKSKTQQSPATETRVSDIVARHKPGQAIGDPRATRMPKFLDMSSDTLHDLLNRAAMAQLAFAGLPARLKGKFNNNPVIMLKWTEQPENRLEALKLGLVVPTPEELQKLALDAAKARRSEQVGIFQEALRADPEAQPDFKKGGPTK